MFYHVFLFLLCLSMYSSTKESTNSKGRVYIDGYNSSNSFQQNQTTVLYKYEKDELLNISCHYHRKRLRLTWLLNGQPIPGKENHTTINTLELNITEHNNKDILTCSASEDNTGLKNGKTITIEAILILNYHVRVNKTTSLEDPEDKLFWTVVGVVVVIAVITIFAILICACIKSYRKNEYKVGLHPAVSNTSVFTAGSRTPIVPRHKITKDNVGRHSPVDSYFTTNSRTLPIPQHKMANNQVGLAVPNVSYFTTDSRKPTSAQHKIAQARYYTNNNYNKRQLHNSREIIDSEYQEPIDSQAYCEPQMYSEPEKQFYAEPIPKILRRTKDTAYVNYNKNNGSANINNENIDLYQNCEHSSDNEFYYYTETS